MLNYLRNQWDAITSADQPAEISTPKYKFLTDNSERFCATRVADNQYQIYRVTGETLFESKSSSLWQKGLYSKEGAAIQLYELDNNATPREVIGKAVNHYAHHIPKQARCMQQKNQGNHKPS